MKNFRVMLLIVVCMLLIGCTGSIVSQDKSVLEESYIEEIASSAYTSTIMETQVVDIGYLQQLLLNQPEVQEYGNVSQTQILATDTRGVLTGVVMTFRNTEGQEFVTNAVIKDSEVLTIQISQNKGYTSGGYRVLGKDKEEGNYTLYSGIVNDNKIKDVNLIYESGTVVNIEVSDQGCYCYLLLRKESNNQDIIAIQKRDQRGNIVSQEGFPAIPLRETSVGKEKQKEADVMGVIVNYYELMYEAYYNKNASEEMFANCLDMTKVQNKNKITAMKKLNLNWNYFQLIYPEYRQASSIVSLHLEGVTKKENDIYEAVIQINGNRQPADYSPNDYLVGMNPNNMELSQSQLPPFVSLGQNIFQLQYQGNHILIQKHSYDGQKNFEGSDTTEVSFDPELYWEQLNGTGWGQNQNSLDSGNDEQKYNDVG